FTRAASFKRLLGGPRFMERNRHVSWIGNGPHNHRFLAPIPTWCEGPPTAVVSIIRVGHIIPHHATRPDWAHRIHLTSNENREGVLKREVDGDTTLGEAVPQVFDLVDEASGIRPLTRIPSHSQRPAGEEAD